MRMVGELFREALLGARLGEVSFGGAGLLGRGVSLGASLKRAIPQVDLKGELGVRVGDALRGRVILGELGRRCGRALLRVLGLGELRGSLGLLGLARGDLRSVVSR